MIARALILGASLAGVTLTVMPTFIELTPLLVWNASASAPIGLYRVRPAQQLKTCDLAVVHPPEPLARFLSDRGYLPRGVPMLKRVLARSGQFVCREGLLIVVDDVAVAPARERDRAGRPLPMWEGCRVVGDDEVFLMNPDARDSLDGRYFGPLPASSVVGRAVPLLTYEEK